MAVIPRSKKTTTTTLFYRGRIYKNTRTLSPSIVHLNVGEFCREGRLKEAIHILLSTHNPPVDSDTYLQLLQTCVAKNAFSEGKLIHSFIADRGFADTFAATTLFQNKLINMYFKCGSFVGARKLFDLLTERNVFSWNIIIAAYTRQSFPQEALTLFRQMQRTGLQPDQFTFATILPACAKMRALEQGMDIHQSIIESGFLSDDVVRRALIHMYSKCGKIYHARELFDKMHQPDVLSWNVMITGYVQNGPVERALEMFKQMQQTGVQPSRFTFASILPAFSKMGAWEQGMDIHRSVIERQLLSDVVVGSALVDMYAKFGSIHKARELFDKMPQLDVVAWTAMIAGYEQNGLLEKALEVFKQMQLTSVKPNSATFASILPACAKMGALELGMDIHQSIKKSGFLSNVVVGNALIDMYAKCGSIDKARELFDTMPQRDVVSWTAMIAGYAMHGCGKDALKLFELMKHSGTNPDHVSLVCVLFACSHIGLVDEGCKHFNGMSDSHCVIPTLDHYVCMVDLLGRAGYLEEALNFIIKMPIKPRVDMWMCLLGWCRSHKNIGLGEFMGPILFELDPINAAPYVLLSDIYAEVGRWGDVQKIRILMKDRGIKKIPGCSWIELHKMIHAFCVRDR